MVESNPFLDGCPINKSDKSRIVLKLDYIRIASEDEAIRKGCCVRTMHSPGSKDAIGHLWTEHLVLETCRTRTQRVLQSLPVVRRANKHLHSLLDVNALTMCP